MAHHDSSRGFTLVETLIAAGILVTVVAGLAQLFALSLQWTAAAGQSGAALIAAQDKLELLRSLRFGYGETGEPVTDERLRPSPAVALVEDVEGFVDWLDPSGAVVHGSAGAEYVRRWRIASIAHDHPAAIAIDVCVFHARGPTAEVAAADVCLATARVRQP